MMKTSLSTDGYLALVKKQTENIIPDGLESKILLDDIQIALDRIKVCISNINLKYFIEDGVPVFDHLNGDQWCMFLYILSNVLYKREKIIDAVKLFNINKALFGIDVFYSTELPEIFYFSHPLGTILGNAVYEDYLVVYQGVTVGSDLDPDGGACKYPKIGKGCALLANCTIVGDCQIGENVIFGANSFLKGEIIGDHKIVLGAYPNHSLRENKYNYKDYYFGWGFS